VGHGFEVGDNPTVNAQFSIEYCVANGLLRKHPELSHFDPASVTDPRILELTTRINVSPDADLNEGQRVLRGRAAMRVVKTDGEVLETVVDGPSGFPTNPMTDEEHADRFWDNVRYGDAVAKEEVEQIVQLVGALDTLEDVRTLIPLMVTRDRAQR
jgi:2-methylcitrate dehydratase PrpD